MKSPLIESVVLKFVCGEGAYLKRRAYLIRFRQFIDIIGNGVVRTSVAE